MLFKAFLRFGECSYSAPLGHESLLSSYFAYFTIISYLCSVKKQFYEVQFTTETPIFGLVQVFFR